MRKFTDFITKWKDEALTWKQSSNRLYEQLTKTDRENRQLRQHVVDLRHQVYLLQQEPKQNPSLFDSSQLNLVVTILNRLPKIRPLRLFKNKANVDLVLLDILEVEQTIQEHVTDPKTVIKIFVDLGLIKRQQGYQYACRVNGEVMRGYAFVKKRVLWFVRDALKPLIVEED
jgi:hypothetical protein